MPDEASARLKREGSLQGYLTKFFPRLCDGMGPDDLEKVFWLTVLGSLPRVAFDGQVALIPFPVVVNKVIYHVQEL